MARAATAFAAAVLATALAAAAGAQAPVPDEVSDPCASVNQTSPGTCDSEITPQARNGEQELGWTWIGGAKFGQTYDYGNARLDGPTPFTVDFFGSDFRTTTEGFFVGDQCIDTETAYEDLKTCERAPAIYHYTVPPGLPAEIHQVYGPEHNASEKEPGFVSAVAWIAPGEAIAVGGTGHYPRRELKRKGTGPGETPESDAEYAARDLAGEEPNAAGRARVWHYLNGRWRELQEEDGELPPTAAGEPMAALTTVDCTPRPASDGKLCWAAGMRQIWRFQDGQFTGESFTPTAVDAEGNATVVDGENWHFRVRSLRFNPAEVVKDDEGEAFAVTSGCCGPNELSNSARVLLFDGVRWHSRILVGHRSTGNPALDPTVEPLRPRQSLPDSYYSLSLIGDQQGRVNGTVLATPGGPRPDAGQPGSGEPASRLMQARMPTLASDSFSPPFVFNVGESCPGLPMLSPYGTEKTSGHLCSELANPNLSEVRFHALGGDFAPAGVESGLADWAVGELPSTGEGVAYTTLRSGTFTPDALTCQDTVASDLWPNPSVDTNCRPRETKDIQEDTRSRSLYSLGTYSLNSIADTPEGEIAFTAGDRGAIVSLGGEGGGAAEPPEPLPERVGSRAPAALPDDGAYAGSQAPLAGESGPVPSLEEQPLEKLPEPRLVPAGAADPTRSNAATAQDVSEMVMSRDGSEGWAIGPGATKTAPGTIFHYAGERWRRCEMKGIKGLVPPDPACAALAGLQRNRDAPPGAAPIQLRALARVPLEYDSDPTNNDELELIAIGDTREAADAQLALLRYRDGRWSVDAEGIAEVKAALAGGAHGKPNQPQFLRDVAFTAPDDGWILAYDGSSNSQQTLVHYDGRGWTSCAKDPVACGDANNVLPFEATGLQAIDTLFLATAGQRLYFAGTGGHFPFIVHKPGPDEPGPDKSWVSDLDRGCLSDDPNCVPSQDTSDLGCLTSISASEAAAHRYAGWASGLFGVDCSAPGLRSVDSARGAGPAPLLRLDPGDPNWQAYSGGDAADDYLLGASPGSQPPPKLLSLRGVDGGEQAVLASAYDGIDQTAVDSTHPMLAWGEDERWRVTPTPFVVSPDFNSYRRRAGAGSPRAMAPDGHGGYWVAVRRAFGLGGDGEKVIFFYHHTDRAPRQVFTEAPHPIREPITAISPAPGGRVWVATESGAVYRYDRVMGWDRAAVKGWDPGRVVTRTSVASAIAVGESGSGVVVGEGGRIADISPGGLRLNPAAGAQVKCSEAAGVTPCGTGNDLVSAAVATDASALVGGVNRAILWRSGDGAPFQAIPKPPASLGATFTGIAMPSPSRAFVVSDDGQVFRGDGPGPDWTWTVEDKDQDDALVTLNAAGKGIALRAIALDPSGERGFAVGDKGLLIQRTGDSDHPWRRLESGVLENLTSLALPPGGGEGAVIGGQFGLILTLRNGRFEVARTDEFTDPLTTAHGRAESGTIAGFALMPGVADGQVEAWAATHAIADNARRPGVSGLLHFTNAPDEPLLNLNGRAQPLPDSPPETPQELDLATLGRSDCHLDDTFSFCVEPQGTNLFNEVLLRRAVDEIAARAEGHERSAALYTGDVNFDPQPGEQGVGTRLPHRRWVELTADRFADPPGDLPGMPLFATMGVLDLAEQDCGAVPNCPGPRRTTGTGSSLPWRTSMAGMPAPWGAGDAESRGDLSFVPVETENPKVDPCENPARDVTCDPTVEDPTEVVPTTTVEDPVPEVVPDVTVTSPVGGVNQTVSPHRGDQTIRGGQLGPTTLRTGGARTHYALDITDTSSDTRLARLVVLDSSNRASVTASDPNQNPTEQQLTWLREVLCKRGSAEDTEQQPCSRDPDERAVVMTNTPTYSYGPGALSDTDAADATQLEQIYASEGVDAVVSGRLGWNGLYYATAPGVHFPCPGGEHPDPAKPAPPPGRCDQPVEGAPDPIATAPDPIATALGARQQACDAAQEAGAPDPSGCASTAGEGGPIPNLIASGAGGTFGPVNNQEPEGVSGEGYWHGYSLLRLDPASGEVYVEQRPIFDWLQIRPGPGTQATHTVRASKKLPLEGFGREPAGMDAPLRYDPITSYAITHLYALLAADPDRPWLPLENDDEPCGPYACLPGNIGHIDPTTGRVTAGKGNYPRTYALAELSAGEQSATYPLVFEPRASFRQAPAPPAPPVAVPPPPPAPAPPNPASPTVNLPAAPVLPVLTAQALAPPPVPPSPPTFASQAPLDLSISPVALDASPPTAVSQPPTPPVNPAPPSGARREARQRQAAAQKSGADSSDGAEETQAGGGDLANSPDAEIGTQAASRMDGGGSETHPAVRRERSRSTPSFSPIGVGEQPSAWVRNALLGGGLGIAGLIVALGLNGARPTPKRREPELPAPAFAPTRRR